MYVLTLKNSHRPDGKIADVLASTLAYTTAADVCSCKLQADVRAAETQNFPSPRWETHILLLVVCRAVVSMSMVAQ
jgi:hypothetical protein